MRALQHQSLWNIQNLCRLITSNQSSISALHASQLELLMMDVFVNFLLENNLSSLEVQSYKKIYSIRYNNVDLIQHRSLTRMRDNYAIKKIFIYIFHQCQSFRAQSVHQISIYTFFKPLQLQSNLSFGAMCTCIHDSF